MLEAVIAAVEAGDHARAPLSGRGFGIEQCLHLVAPFAALVAAADAAKIVQGAEDLGEALQIVVEWRGGFFRAHRDNTTAGTAHRVFACTVNLNAEEYDGGDLRFPEYGARTYRAPTGGAVVFSCSLLHEAMPVTRGKRYAFLPFFYDEQKAQLREANQVHFANGDGAYRAGPAGDPEDTARKAGQKP